MTQQDIKRAVMDEWRNLRRDHMAELAHVSIRFSKRMTRTLGSCRFKRQGYGLPARCFEVVLSDSITLPEVGLEQAIDTLRHEAAHAIVGVEAKHGPVWKAMARELGATPKACGTLDASQREARRNATKPKWTIRCERCGIEDTRQRLSRDRQASFRLGMLRHAAGCGGVLNLIRN